MQKISSARELLLDSDTMYLNIEEQEGCVAQFLRLDQGPINAAMTGLTLFSYAFSLPLADPIIVTACSNRDFVALFYKF